MPAGPPVSVSSSVLTLPSPFCPSDRIGLLESPECDRSAVLRRVETGDYDKPFVLDDGTTRSLHFSLALIQSTMSLKDPFALELDYTRAMMSFLLFLPRPRHLLMLGLGGGSLVKYCHRHLGSARLTVVEIDPHVIAFRDEFEVPPDDGRLQVIQGDGAAWVADCSERPDVILLDAFDRDGLSGSVSNETFYGEVCAALAGRGWLVANLAGDKAERVAHRDMIAAAFGERVWSLTVPDGGNDIVLAARAEGFAPRWRELANQARALRARLGLDFPDFVRRLERSQRLRWT